MTRLVRGTRARLPLLLPALLALIVSGSLALPQSASAAPAASPAAGAARGTASAGLTTADMTRYVYEQTNKVRFDKGLPGYVRDARLDKVAQAWALQQWKNGKMSHNPDYSTQIPAGWTRAGENVASGYTYTQVVGAWVASPTHYANLVRDYTSIGIGFYESGGKRYWVQTFAKYPGTKVPTQPAAAPRPVYAPEPAAPAGAPVSLSSPSFEGTLSGWSAGGGRLEGPVVSAKGGKFDLAILGSRTVSQVSATRPIVGATYSATIWVKPASTSAVSGSLRLTALGGTAETATMAFTVSSGWMKVSVPLKVVRSGHSGLRLEVVLGSGEFRLDSASIVQTQAPATAAPTRTAPSAPARAEARALPARR